ncbi:MAG: N-6 DNA methylase, partial [Natronomonas sp.]|uniref:Eco57I restriction-modification methylase domain-containing protein n=1 Tax=Natronomonas sp. TaxID=2184060 RepID=UPI002870551B
MSQATLSGGYHNSNLFSNYYLDERIYDLDGWDCDEEARAAFEEIEALYREEIEYLPSYKEDQLLDHWIDEILRILGFQNLSEATVPDGGGYVDRLLFDSGDDRRDAAHLQGDGQHRAAFGVGSTVLEAKQWGADFEARFDEDRNYRDASHQIKHYLESTPEEIEWGVLTDGRKWRLYGTKDYETKTYYEVDLPELIESGSVEVFKRFFVFFRPEAFREVAGTTFLETVWSESETAAQQLGEDLQDHVFTALRVVGEGFVETNDLAIDPDDDAALSELKEQSLVLLYRLMFVLYAEARGLIHPEGPRAESEYRENFSLEQIREEIYEAVEGASDVDEGDAFEREFSAYSTGIWASLGNLFDLIDSGNEDLGIPPYNGGLFDDDKHEFLAEHGVSDRHLAEAIYRVSTTGSETGDGDVLADYADLDTRHLGSIYEGLLEHQFKIAPEDMAAVADDGGQTWKPATEVSVADAVESVDAGELYVINDDGERKATGAYYTPDYVVTYIVEETVDPLLDDIRADLESEGYTRGEAAFVAEFAPRVKQLKVLDPAMGSGHFLTKATGYLTEQIMAEARTAEVGTLFDEQRIKREIAKECIYGVDINEMAVELAKLSMWLETLAADQPLAFLDHHLKDGNSLVGSDVTEVLTDDTENGDGQLTLTQALARVRQDTLEHVMELMEDLLAIDNETLEEVRSMEEIYETIREDPLYKRLFELTNVHTAERFGVDVPADAYETMAGAIEREAEWETIRGEEWFKNAQTTAEAENFFHWELEYPEVFFNEDGEKMDGSGFDVVVGNPPWVDIKGLDNPELLFDFFDTSYNRVNIYSAFIERSTDLLAKEAQFGFITPNSYHTQSSYLRLREHLIDNYSLHSIVRLPDGVFNGVTMETAILTATLDPDSQTNPDVLIFSREADISEISESNNGWKKCNVEWWKSTDELIFDLFTTESERNVIQKIESANLTIGSEFESCLGLTPYDKHQGHSKSEINNRVFHSTEKESEKYYPITTGEGIDRYRLTWEGGEYIKYGEWLGAP